MPAMAVLFRAVLLIFIILTCFWANLSHAQTSNTIKPGQVLPYSGKLLVSADGRFQLGFFNISYSEATGYLGIWFTSTDYVRNVWVAKPGKPISGVNISLTLDSNGILKITRGKGNPIPLNANQTATNSIATLENSGNLVVKELNSDGSVKRVLWESFDNPTDTLLPGMKLGKSLRTGKRWVLTSWLSGSNPGPGPYTLEYEHRNSAKGSGGVLVIKRRGGLYWTSKPIGELFGKDHISYVSYETDTFFSYSLNGTRNWRLWVSPSGKIGYGDLSSRTTHLSQCYGSLFASGCAQQQLPTCRSRRDKFEERKVWFLQVPSTSYVDDNSSINLSDCWDRCWKNCSCVGFETFNQDETGCVFWTKGAEFEQRYDGSGYVIQVLNSSSPIVSNQKPHIGLTKKWWIWVIISTVAVIVVLLSGFLCSLRRKILRERKEELILKELTTSEGFNNEEEIIGFDGKKGQDLKLFSFASILEATDNFSVESKLGQGGFGPVFKGKLADGQEIAIKLLSRSSGQGLLEFKNELTLIAKLQHLNLVRILGCCVTGDEKMLIYEYMPNKSLDFFLFDRTRRELLEWKKRYNIIEGTAQGLLYLHRYSRLRIIHRDIKASNILLNRNMNPKISDFGMARIFGRNESDASTNRIVGTYGYMSPEYAMEGTFSEKSDIYSFGVLLLEIISGRRNTGFYSPECHLNLVGYSWELWNEGKILELTDSSLAGNSSGPHIERCIRVGLLCVQDRAADRPTMADVLPMIANQNVPLPVPKQVRIPLQFQMKNKSYYGTNQESSSIATSVT